MNLSSNDLNKIKTTLEDVIRPRFDELCRRADTSQQTTITLKRKLDHLTVATNRKFHTAFTDITVTREEVRLIQKMLADHHERLQRLARDHG